MSPRDKMFLLSIAVIAAGLAIAAARIGYTDWRRRRQSAWNRKYARCQFADRRFKPSREEVEQRLKEYALLETPTHLRTRAEDDALMPQSLRRQAP